MALAALVLLALLVVVVVVLAVRQVRLGVQHKRMRLRVDALDARVGGVQRRLEEVPGIGTGRHEVALVLNPIKTHADRVRRELERLAAAEGLGEVLVLETQEDDPGTAMARQALDAGARLVIAAGGDGTVRTVAEQLAGTDVALGVVPLGTGNLLARNLDLPINDVEQCLRIAVGGRQRRIDTVDVRFTHEDGRVTRQTFTVIGGAGYDADIMGDTKDELKSLAGWLAYSEAGMRHLRGKRHEVTVALDGGQPRRFKVRTVMVANCGMLTGGVELLPQAKLDDGLLDVMCDEDDGGARAGAGPDGVQILDQPPTGDAVQRRERLVQQQQVGAGDQGAGQRHPHGHAARKLARTRRQAIAQADGGQGLVRAGSRLGPGQAGELERQGHIGPGVGPWHQGGALEDEAGAAGGGGAQDLAAAGLLQSRQQPKRRRLASARGTDQGDDLAGGYGQVQRPQGRSARIGDRHVPQRGGRCVSHGPADSCR